jgi:hypothetical protein
MKIARTKPVMVPEAVPEAVPEIARTKPVMAQRVPTRRQTTRRPASVGVIVIVTKMRIPRHHTVTKASTRFCRGQNIFHANVITVALVASDAQS